MREKRYAVFIDGSNNAKAAIAAKYKQDFDKILAHFNNIGTVVNASYFTALPASKDVFVPLRAVTDYLQYHGWDVVTKPTKDLLTEDGIFKSKGNMDIELCMKAVRLVTQSTIDNIVLFTGDGDFVALVEWMKEHGIHVTVISHFSHRDDNIVADELRRACNQFIPLTTMRTEFISTKPPKSPEAVARRRQRFLDGQ